MTVLFLVLLLASPLLWGASLFLLAGWQYFWRYFAFQLLLLLALLYVGTRPIFGHDEYGLGAISIISVGVILQTAGSFLFALARRIRSSGPAA